MDLPADREPHQQALIRFEQNYAHLPLKRALHAVDPVRRLRSLLQEIESGADAFRDSDIGFHNAITDIFMSVRDLHTNYLLPQPYAGTSAFLPFMVEDCFGRAASSRSPCSSSARRSTSYSASGMVQTLAPTRTASTCTSR